MLSPIIFIALLFAPTVPSDPNPQNLQAVVPSSATFMLLVISIEVWVTSSLIPNVNPFFKYSPFKWSNTVTIWSGVVSFEPSPYLPPIITGF